MNYLADSPANQLVREGDICVIHISEHCRYKLKIEANTELQTKFGLLKASDLLGHPYGVRYDLKRGWVLPLRLTPELWTQMLPHRTQILYESDISMILLQLDIKPGSVVVESGTGSGSLSHAILRACRPHGLLHTFDVNESRVSIATKEFEEHGFGANVRVVHRNVCELGYGPELEGQVDACILDLPQTWTAIEHAYRVLKADGSRLCTFSPCVEQAQQNVAKMVELKLKDIVTIECVRRPLEVRSQRLRWWSDEILDGLVAIDGVRFANLASELAPAKRPKISGNPTSEESPTTRTISDGSMEVNELRLLNSALNDPKAPFSANLLPKRSHLHAKQLGEIASHSGYLTFASKRP